jgi:co-chaperonin GroES (HSP10)
MEIKPLNNIILAKILEEPEDHSKSSIALPGEDRAGRFIKLEVLDVGELVSVIVPGDKIIANNLFEIISLREPKIGFINSKDVLGIIKK